ncbi:MAG: serine/threonine-protein kinase [Elusimicrobia bacterium]|nr:serine/threonine-protein kinase [Elusimicrobiota bacterium]
MDITGDLTNTVFAGCRLIKKIGQGGMGTVYTARHETLDKVVCVKLLAPELARDQRNIDFFLREARSAAKLDHPNIVQVYNFGQENNSYFIVMSYVEGRTLSEIVTEKGPLAVPEATEMILGVLEGLAHAHSKSIIHRDIKPSNILVGLDGVPRIADFGLARSINEEKQLTIAGEMVGTAYFMSPEQGLAGSVDARSDLYCTGATYFYILTGRFPFEGKNSIEVIHKHISEPFPNIILIKPDIPLWVSRILEKAMRKKPDDRYQSARELIADLKKCKDTVEQNSSSWENSFDIPEITSRMNVPPPPSHSASLERADPRVSDRSGRAAAAPEPVTAPRQQGGKPAAAKKTKFQLSALYNAVQILLHSALALAATGCFIISGASGRVTGSLYSPFIDNPVTAGFFAVLGAALFAWTVSLKPLKFTFQHAFLLAAAAVAAYAGGAYIPAPETVDTVAKAFFALKISLENAFSSANILIYALFLYLAASKVIFRDNWILKTAAIAAYLFSMFLTYTYFKGGLAPEQTYMAAAVILALAGIVTGATVKEFSLFYNPPVLFLAANALVFVMFTNPMVSAITDEKVRAAALQVSQENRMAMVQYHLAVMSAESEPQYDLEGRPIEKKLPPQPQEIQPPARGELSNAARAQYYAQLEHKIGRSLADSAGIIFIALFLMLMADVCFAEELLAVYMQET